MKTISLITCLPPAYIRFSQENLCNSPNGPSHHLKYHLQLKKKEYVGSLRGDQLWEVVRKIQGKVIMQIYTSAFSTDKNFQRCVHVCTLSRVLLFATPWTIACQAPVSMELSRQEYWSGYPFATPGGLLPRHWTQGSCIGRRILYHWAAREAAWLHTWCDLL